MADGFQAVILVGGQGTRIAELFPDCPKALVPIGKEVFLARMLKWLAARGFAGAHLAAGYRAEQIRAWLAENRTPLPVSLSVEPCPLGTGGGLKFAVHTLAAERFFVFNGDSLLPGFDPAAMWQALAAMDNAAGMAVVPAPDAGRFGSVEIAPDGKITGFREKATGGAGWVNAGVYLLSKRMVEDIPLSRQPLSLEREIFPRWAAAGLLYAWRASPPLLDMGTPAGWREMQDYFAGCSG